MRAILAHNITRKLHEVFVTQANKDRALANAAGVSLSTVQRIRRAEVGASIDQIEEIAKALGISVAELLTPREEIRRFLLAAEPAPTYDAAAIRSPPKKQIKPKPRGNGRPSG